MWPIEDKDVTGLLIHHTRRNRAPIGNNTATDAGERRIMASALLIATMNIGVRAVN